MIDGLRIHEVPLDPASARIAVVVTIPAAKGRARHQAKDDRYYRRHNFSNQIMNDSEVRDTMRRATTPELFVALRLGNRQQKVVEFESRSEISKPHSPGPYWKPIAATRIPHDCPDWPGCRISP